MFIFCKTLFNFFCFAVSELILNVCTSILFTCLNLLIRIFVDALHDSPNSVRVVPHVRYLLISNRRMIIVLFLDPRFPDRITMLNGSWIRVCLHVTRLAFDEQSGQYVNRERRRSKCTTQPTVGVWWNVPRINRVRRRLLLITGIVDWQSHAVGSTHRRHGRRTPYRVHR